ncbi:MAG: hypothetical protein QM775_19175 [Pirellulales bacterium]
MRVSFAAALLVFAATMNDEHFASAAEPLPPPNYDEAKVGNDPLPDLLTYVDGSKVTDVAAWTTKRRPELLELYRSEMFGRCAAEAGRSEVRSR